MLARASCHMNRRRVLRFLVPFIFIASLGFIYTAFHHHHDFSAHPDCPICTLSAQAPVITTPTEGPAPERTFQPLFQEACNQPPDPLFSTSTAPRAPPA